MKKEEMTHKGFTYKCRPREYVNIVISFVSHKIIISNIQIYYLMWMIGHGMNALLEKNRISIVQQS